MSNENRNASHGHVTPRPDGAKARCGGPLMCKECCREQAALAATPQQPAQAPDLPEVYCPRCEMMALRNCGSYSGECPIEPRQAPEQASTYGTIAERAEAGKDAGMWPAQAPVLSEERERVAFEAWLRSAWTPGYGCPKLHDGRYVSVEAQRFWECWQARALLSTNPKSEPTAAAPAPVDALREMGARKDAAYEERNRCVALIARMAVVMGRDVRVTRTAIEGWSDDWHGCVYIDLPTGQASWHFHDSQAALFAGLPTGDATWDGHDTPEKYRRVEAAYAGDYECPGRRGGDPRGCWRVRCQLGAKCVQAPAAAHEPAVSDRDARALEVAREALGAILRDPTGCPFCDSGKLRKSVRTGELCEHDEKCGFKLAHAAMSAAAKEAK